MTAAAKAPESSADDRLTVGSQWSDNYDERFPRIVEVVKIAGSRVVIKTVRMSGNPGYARHTETDASRFGKPGRTGFTFVSSSVSESKR